MSNEKDLVLKFCRNLNLPFNNLDLIQMALVHPSYSQEKSGVGNNQRLEFLGDAVLNFVLAEYLYNHYKDKAEGDLTKIRARVVCERSLMEVAKSIDLGQYLLLGKGEEMSGGRRRKSILADAVESVIGAIYLDQGYQKAAQFILAYLEGLIQEAARGDYNDYKSRLQELVQGKNKQNVYYQIINESGPAHAKVFTAGVYYQGHLLATGSGKSKKEAEQKAAEAVIKNEQVLQYLDKVLKDETL
jgi:ribonuclease-3